MRIVDENHAPGRRLLKRSNGRISVYWVASRAAVKAGYSPKTVHLTDDPGDVIAPEAIAARCRIMWAEMLEYLAGAETPRGPGVGTIAWIVGRYLEDEDSPFHGLRAATRPSYKRALAIVSETVGERRIESVLSSDVRRWFRQWGRADAEGALANPRRAYWCAQVLRIAVKYGKGLRDRACRDLSEILTETEFSAPKGRRVAMTAAQAAAIIGKARELGWPSIARAVALQFGCALRQKDVIGEWVGGQWTAGLLWGEHVKSDWRLEKPTSKSNFSEVAEFDLRLIPPAMAELSAVPPTSRIGPVILDERSGKPYRQREFARRFREAARAAGVPDSIWNMDARAGAVTDAYAAGASPKDAMDFATHNQPSTSRLYDRGRINGTSRVAVLRFKENGK